MTSISDLRSFIRALLGDVCNLGVWQYTDEQLDSAVRTVFATGNAPAGYTLNTTGGTVAQIAGATKITPDLTGVPLAKVLYQSATLIATGIAGATDIRTRTFTVKEGSERKLSLLLRFHTELSRLEDEGDDGSGISTRQGLVQWMIANSGGTDAYGFATSMTYTGGTDLSA